MLCTRVLEARHGPEDAWKKVSSFHYVEDACGMSDVALAALEMDKAVAKCKPRYHGCEFRIRDETPLPFLLP